MDLIPTEQPTTSQTVSIGKLAEALVKARARMSSPPKDKQNPHLKNWYADLASVIAAVTPALNEQGLTLLQLPCEMGDGPALCSILAHTSGEWIRTVIKLRPSKLDPQGVGSALTYARRYAIQSLCGVTAEDDDDGHAASQPRGQQRQAPAGQQAAQQSPPASKPGKAQQSRDLILQGLKAKIAAAKSGAELDALKDSIRAAKSVIGEDGVSALVDAGKTRRHELEERAAIQGEGKQQTIPAGTSGPYGEGR